MASDYLWDRSGEDAETQKLEMLLAPYRCTQPLRTAVRVGSWWQLAAAVTIVIVAGAEIWWTWQPPGDVWRAPQGAGRTTGSPRGAPRPRAIVQTADAPHRRPLSGAGGRPPVRGD